jgi:hypothetical protein
MISEYDEIEMSFLEQSKDLNKYQELIKSLDGDLLTNELEMLEWQIRGCYVEYEKPLMALKDIVTAEIKLREVTK